MQNEITQITDENLAEVAQAERGVLVLSKSDCGHCKEYAAEILEAQSEGRLDGIAVGKLLLDARGSSKFKRKNPWIGKLDSLPYTILFTEGKAADHFAASKADYLVERLERIAPEPVAG